MRLAALAVLAASLAVAAPTETAEQRLVAANTAFATDLYGALPRPANLFFSPYSVSVALGMTWGGASGVTEQELAKALHFGGVDVHAGFEALQKRLAADPKAPYQLAVANRLFAEQHFTFLPEFLALARDRYGAPLELLDFKNAAEPSRLRINGWVEKQTNDRIKDLIGAGLINGQTRLVLVNAIYFKGTWAQPFEPKATSTDTFTSGRAKLDVKMMHGSAYAGLGERDGVQVLELPYKGNALSMVVLLPKATDGLEALEARLTPKLLGELVAAAAPREVDVSLPKFKLVSSFALTAPLQKLGVATAFECDEGSRADFSRMAARQQLCISAVVHKAFVEVNELGTEAAAATAVIMSATAVAAEPAVFRADHPFLFAIRDRRSGSILFLGRLTDPTK